MCVLVCTFMIGHCVVCKVHSVFLFVCTSMTGRCVVFRAQCVPSRVPSDPMESTVHRSARAATVASVTTSAVSASARRATLEKGTCCLLHDWGSAIKDYKEVQIRTSGRVFGNVSTH